MKPTEAQLTNRQVRGEIKTIRRVGKHQVRQLDHMDAWMSRIEQKMEERMTDLGRKLEWRQDWHLFLFTAIFILVFMMVRFFG